MEIVSAINDWICGAAVAALRISSGEFWVVSIVSDNQSPAYTPKFCLRGFF
jgi:hypothetical protein